MWGNQALALATDGVATDRRVWQLEAKIWRLVTRIRGISIYYFNAQYCQSRSLQKLIFIQGSRLARR
jgi:hypothetical protein